LASRGIRAVNPAAILATLGIDASLHVARVAYQYRAADQHARERAHQLRERLLALRCQYKCVRVVAHSLGCRHTLEALRNLNSDESVENYTTIQNDKHQIVDPRPDWLHLCAPACTESDVADVLAAGPARRGTFIYYTKCDTVLAYMFRIMHPQQLDALGAIGPIAGLGAYPGVYGRAVDDIFTWRVHTAYARKFYQFAMAPG
jgi:esterase/lipase superfamily enzyme